MSATLELGRKIEDRLDASAEELQLNDLETKLESVKQDPEAGQQAVAQLEKQLAETKTLVQKRQNAWLLDVASEFWVGMWEDQSERKEKEKPPPSSPIRDHIRRPTKVLRKFVKPRGHITKVADISQFVRKSKGKENKVVLEEYLVAFEGKKEKKQVYNLDDMYCKECHTELIIMIKESDATCPKCGYAIKIILPSNTCPIWDKDREYTTPFAYKHVNHFLDWLYQVQGKESTAIPDIILNLVLKKIGEKVIWKRSDIDAKKVRLVLQELQQPKYYEHSFQIASFVSGIPPPQFPADVEILLCSMFHQVFAIWPKYKPPQRNNFFSYSYILHKFVRILKLPNFYLDAFPLLKSPDKLTQQDRLFRAICQDLKWTFYKSL